MTQQVLDEEIVVLSEDEADAEKHIHLVHYACTFGAVPRPDFVVAMCGVALGWEERSADDGTKKDCAACAEAKMCPVCKMERW